MSEATTTPSAGGAEATTGERATGGAPPGGRSFRSTLSALELDPRLLGMVVALAVIYGMTMVFTQLAASPATTTTVANDFTVVTAEEPAND